ncbi:hypothetical protein [Deinococcus fonticola]|uniref:hypothetical protein n=1 Tax=Deinococcus fonticola TaxID=2528713 RepID=UPI00197AF69B|nr:hypothetical protein [Deinococcus fonticola]
MTLYNNNPTPASGEPEWPTQPVQTQERKQIPTVGRIVHYVSYGTPGGEYAPQHRAAIVTGVHTGSRDIIVSLCVLNPTGVFFPPTVAQDEKEKRPGTWHWPERV